MAPAKSLARVHGRVEAMVNASPANLLSEKDTIMEGTTRGGATARIYDLFIRIAHPQSATVLLADPPLESKRLGRISYLCRRGGAKKKKWNVLGKKLKHR